MSITVDRNFDHSPRTKIDCLENLRNQIHGLEFTGMHLDTFPFVVSFQGGREHMEPLCELLKVYAKINREKLAIILTGINLQTDTEILERLGLRNTETNNTSALLEVNFLDENQPQKSHALLILSTKGEIPYHFKYGYLPTDVRLQLPYASNWRLAVDFKFNQTSVFKYSQESRDKFVEITQWHCLRKHHLYESILGKISL